MANLADTLLNTSSDFTVVHRRMVRVGAAAAWFATLVFVVVGLSSGDQLLTAQAVPTALAGSFMTGQIILRRENAYLGLIAAAIVVAVFHGLMGLDGALVPAAVALVIISALAMVFVESRVALVVASVGILLFAVPHFWGLSFGESWILGAVMSLSFVTTAVILLSIRSAMLQLHARFQMLFENSPTALTEEDWSDAVAYVRSEYAGRPDRIKPFLLAYPEVARRAVSRARIVRVNRAAVELLEAGGPEDLLGSRHAREVTDATLEAFVDALVTLYEEKATFEQEVRAQTLKGRPIWLQTRAVDTSPDTPAQRIIMGLSDVSHIKEHNEAMARLVKSKDEFIARVSHELRTPLTAVVGLTSEMASVPAEEREELLQLVAGQAAEMSYIVEDLLVAARAEMGTVAIDMTAVDLEHELNTTIQGLGMRVDETPSTVPNVRADPSRVRQILRNLLTNADRYGGPHVRVLSGEVHDRVWLEVRDDGEGVDEDMVDAIFDPYTTAHEGFAGSVGLGLSVARQLAQMMGGSLDYRNDGQETAFRLELPADAQSKLALASEISSR